MKHFLLFCLLSQVVLAQLKSMCPGNECANTAEVLPDPRPKKMLIAPMELKDGDICIIHDNVCTKVEGAHQPLSVEAKRKEFEEGAEKVSKGPAGNAMYRNTLIGGKLCSGDCAELFGDNAGLPKVPAVTDAVHSTEEIWTDADVLKTDKRWNSSLWERFPEDDGKFNPSTHEKFPIAWRRKEWKCSDPKSILMESVDKSLHLCVRF